MNIIITGASGRLGKELKKFFPSALTPDSRTLDITDREAVDAYIAKHRPDAIIHLAAMTSIPECEHDKTKAWKINVQGTKNLLNACAKHSRNCYFFYMSTACVFDGEKGGYVEDDVPAPKNYYSLTKVVAESAVDASPLEKKLIIRSNFVPRERWPYPGAFVDRYGTYLFAEDLAGAIRDVFRANQTGIIHITGDRKLSMYELAKITTPEVAPISYKEFEKAVDYHLTVDMSLDSARWKKYKLGGSD